MRVLPIFLFFAVPPLLLGCGEHTTVTYKLRNIATDPVIVVSAPRGQVKNDTFVIRYNETRTIAVVGQGNGHVSQYKETGASLHDLARLEVYTADTTAYTADLKATARWAYTERYKHAGEYLLTLTTKDR